MPSKEFKYDIIVMNLRLREVNQWSHRIAATMISDKTWQLLEFHLPGRKATWGGNARDNRQFINAVFWILRSGAPWRDLPPDYGDWKNTHRRFCRWRDRGVWENLLELLVDEPDYEWLIIDAASHIKVHPHATGG